MKKQLTLVAVLLLAIVLAFLGGRASSPTAGMTAEESTAGSRQVLYWFAPMDPSFRRDVPGKSPMGMDLVPKYADEVDGQPGVVAIDPTMVNIPYAASIADAMEKLRYDLYYIKNLGSLFDLTIILRTVGVILFGKGAR